MKSSFSFSHFVAVLSLMAVVALFVSTRTTRSAVEEAGYIECRFDSGAIRLRCVDGFH